MQAVRPAPSHSRRTPTRTKPWTSFYEGLGRILTAALSGSDSEQPSSTVQDPKSDPCRPLQSKSEWSQRSRNKQMKVLMVDEWMTTQLCCVAPYEKLGVPERQLPGGGTTTDRDVRFCSSELLLGSRHPCPPLPSLVEGLELPAGMEWVDRDHNSAHCMMDLMGLSHDKRPTVFQRPRPMPPHVG